MIFRYIESYVFVEIDDLLILIKEYKKVSPPLENSLFINLRISYIYELVTFN